MTVIRSTEEFRSWAQSLERREFAAVERAVELLKASGISLGAPHTSALRGTSFPLRELRPSQGRSPVRVIYGFDPNREVLLLLGGSKAAEARFYRRAIARAEILWTRHLEQLQGMAGP